MRDHVAVAHCPHCPEVLAHYGERPRLPEALQLHVELRHPGQAGSDAVRRRLIHAAWSDLVVACWNAIAARQPRAWRHR